MNHGWLLVGSDWEYNFYSCSIDDWVIAAIFFDYISERWEMLLNNLHPGLMY